MINDSTKPVTDVEEESLVAPFMARENRRQDAFTMPVMVFQDERKIDPQKVKHVANAL